MPTYRSDVVGSLLRPAYLVAARREVEGGRLTPAEFKGLEDRAVDEAIELQETSGLAVVTDGEMRRYAFFGHLIEALDGFDKLGGWAIPFRDEQGAELVFKRPVVVERLRWRRSMCAEEWVYLRGHARRPGKTTLISAQQAAAYYDPDKSRAAYPTRDRRPDRGARPGDDQEGPSRDGGGARGADRGRRQDRPAGAPGALTAVRFRLDTGGQPHHARGPAEEAPGRRRHRARRVGRLGAPRPVTGGRESPRG